MYKLAGLDAGFLYMETPRTPQHIASIQVLERPEGITTDQFVADLKRLLLARAHLVPYFTNVLQHVPFDLDHPVWVRDAAFDIDHHVRQVAVAAPGGRAEFEAKIAELHAKPLNRNRPLWELWVLSGLEGGRLAYYNRVHHACLDGVSGQAAVEAIMDPTPEVRDLGPAPETFAARSPRRTTVDLLTGAMENFAKFQLRQAGNLLEHLDTARRVLQRTFDPGKGLGAITESAPPTRFNRCVQAGRSYATGELPLGDMRSIGKATGTSLNDVFLAVCAGGLRSYFERLGELPVKPLIAGCPVSLRKPGDTSANNQVSMMMVECATDEADPVKRLLRINRSSGQGKGFVAAIAGSYDADIAIPGLPGLMRSVTQWLEASNLADRGLPGLPCNTVISNVPGPRQTMYSLGSRVLTHYPVSIPTHGQGVNITVQSYTDTLYFGITACAQALPEAGSLRDDLLAAFAELKARVLKEPTTLIRPERPAEVAPAAAAAMAAESLVAARKQSRAA